MKVEIQEVTHAFSIIFKRLEAHHLCSVPKPFSTCAEMKNLIFIVLCSVCVSHHVVNGINMRIKDRAVCEIDGVSSMENLRQINFAPNNSSKVKNYCYRIKFTNSSFQEFPENFFDKMKEFEVREIVAKNVGLNKITSDDFMMAENVVNLKLSSNQIESLFERNFMHLENLKSLDLSSNFIRNIHNEAFDTMAANFSKIDLSRNRLISFKEKFLMDMSKTPEGPEILLNSNEIYMVEPVDFLNTYGSVKRRIKLLDLSSNKLKVFGLPSLNFTSLRLNNNMLEKLLTPTVRDLEMNDNRMQEIYISSSMVNLSASNNRINEIQCDQSLRIERLRLAKNNIFSDVFNCLKYTRSLKTLDLSNNPLGFLNVDSFSEATQLEELNLASTDLKKLSFGLFGQQSNLRYLDISGNDLGKIDYYMLASLSSLEAINIGGNKLKEFSGYKKLREISKSFDSIGLENNNWKCDYLGKMWLKFNQKQINVMDPKNPMKTKSNIGGIKCFSKSDKDEQEKIKKKNKN